MSVSNRIFKTVALFSSVAVTLVLSGCNSDPVKEEIVTPP